MIEPIDRAQQDAGEPSLAGENVNGIRHRIAWGHR
jgi:hypothetical protein